MDVERPSILVAPDVTPSETARLDPTKVLGICTEMGGATSHSAILARALGIPSVAGLSGATRYLHDGQIVAMDGTAGRVWLHPDQATLHELEARREQWQQEQRQARAAGQGPAVTQDGQVVQVVANIAGLNDADAALEYGAEGVGVFRTEFLFMDRTHPPTEEEQLAAYQRVAQIMGTRRLVIRTLDVGGDKPLPYLDSAVEMNPFLGWRGIRFCLDHPEIFKMQLRAILRASPGHHIQLLFPMISTPSELRAAKNLLAAVQEDLQSAGIAFDREMAVGVMIEVPSAVAVADQLAGGADFFSIGSNDLAQYVMAADRGNERVSPLADALQPSVLRLIAQTVQAAHAAGIPVAVCGELAGDPQAAPLLVGLGVDELSMNAPNIPAVKQAIRGLSLAAARQVAGEVLALETVEAVRDYLSTTSSISNSVPNACRSAST
jgi:phosphocarrier protein FPr